MALKSTNGEHDILCCNFNQDASCISVGTRCGYRIYNCEPFGRCFHEAPGGIGVVEMLFCTSLVALVGAGEKPAFSPRRLRIFNTKSSKAICELNFVTAILGVRLNKKRLVVVLEVQIYIFDLNTMKILQTLETASNKRGLCALSPNDVNCYIAFATSTPGEVVLYDAMNLTVVNAIPAHTSSPTCIAFNQAGNMLVTSSEKGTVIRVFEVPSGAKLFTFRRGSYPTVIYSLSFSADSSLLCASSETGTVHIFQLSNNAKEGNEDASSGSSGSGSSGSGSSGSGSGGGMTASGSSIGSGGGADADADKSVASSLFKMGASASALAEAYLPAAMSDVVECTRNFAHAKLRNAGVPNLASIRQQTGEAAGTTTILQVVSIDGYYYEYNVDTVNGGECRLERENVLRESESEEIGQATYYKS